MELVIFVAVVIVVIWIVAAIAAKGNVERSVTKAVEGGSDFRNSFRTAWRSEYGTYPSDAASDAVRDAAITIISNAGNSSSYAESRLREAVERYVDAVGHDQNKASFGLSQLLLCCYGPNGSIYPPFQWAATILADALRRHCPRMFNAVMGM